MNICSEPAALPEWQAIVSGNAQLSLSPVLAGRTAALRMDFDFKGGGGFVVARRAFKRAMPEEYCVKFRLRGSGAVNHLELKLVDTTGQNVWRHVYRDLRPPPRWKSMTLDSRDIEFAWGPSSGGRIAALGSMEFAIVAGEGGKGTLWIAGVEIEDRGPRAAPTASASSELPDFEPRQPPCPGAAGNRGPMIRTRGSPSIPSSRATSAALSSIGWSRRRRRAFGFAARTAALAGRPCTLQPAPAANAATCICPASRLDSCGWKSRSPLRAQACGCSHSSSPAPSTPSGTTSPTAKRAAGILAGCTMNRACGRRSARRNGIACALLNEDGMLEVDQGSFSIEPMLFIEGRLFTWADVDARQELLEDWMPVALGDLGNRQSGGCAFKQRRHCERRIARALPAGESHAMSRLRAQLFVLVRPFQVTPPWQSFRNLGGVSKISDLAWRDGAVSVNGAMSIAPLGESTATAAARFARIALRRGIHGVLPGGRGAAAGHRGATIPSDSPPARFEFELSSSDRSSLRECLELRAGLRARSTVEAAFDWRPLIPAEQWAGNGWARDAILAALTATAHILVTRSGPALQPGPRRYTRSWIRDGAMMSAALLRMGRTRRSAGIHRVVCAASARGRLRALLRRP